MGKDFFFDAPFESHFIDLAFLCKSLPGNVFLTLLFDITLPYFNLVKGNYQIIRSSIFSSTYNYKEFDASAVKLPKLWYYTHVSQHTVRKENLF